MPIKVDEKAKKVQNPPEGSNPDENLPSALSPESNPSPSEKKAAGKKGGSKKAAEKAPESEIKEENKGKINLKTSKPVVFIVDSKKYEGTEFSLPEQSIEERKADLIAEYGKDIIIEE